MPPCEPPSIPLAFDSVSPWSLINEVQPETLQLPINLLLVVLLATCLGEAFYFCWSATCQPQFGRSMYHVTKSRVTIKVFSSRSFLFKHGGKYYHSSAACFLTVLLKQSLKVF